MFEFYPSAYLIHYGESKIIEKRYEESLDAEQKQQIITECTKYALARIRAALQSPIPNP